MTFLRGGDLDLQTRVLFLGMANPPLPLPGLDTAAVRRLGGSWDDGGLWDDIERLADAVFARQGDRRLGFLWHHLVLAVGNFKRQPGRRLYPAPLIRPTSKSARATSLVVPVDGGELSIGVLQSDSWFELKKALRGAGTATVTTLLAALWPEEHVVFDWRVHAAANGLRLSATPALASAVDPKRKRPAAITLGDYTQVRQWIVDHARILSQDGDEVRPHEVERSRYRLSQDESLKPPKGRLRSWGEYASLVRLALPNAPGPAVTASGHGDDIRDGD